MQRFTAPQTRIVSGIQQKGPVNTSFSHPIRQNKGMVGQNTSTILPVRTLQGGEIIIQKAQPNQVVARPIRVSRTSENQPVQIKEPIIERIGGTVQGATVVFQSSGSIIQPQSQQILVPSIYQQPSAPSNTKPASAIIQTQSSKISAQGDNAVTKIGTSSQLSNVSASTPKFVTQSIALSDQVIPTFQQTAQQQNPQTFEYTQPIQLIQSRDQSQNQFEKMNYKQDYQNLKNMYQGLEQRFTQLRTDYERQIKDRIEKPTDRSNTIGDRTQPLHSETAIEQLREENQQLVNINRQFQAECTRLMEQLSQKNDIDIDKVQALLQEKDDEINALNTHIERINAESNEMKEHLQSIKGSYDRERIDILEAEIERLNSEIIKKNGEIISFKKANFESEKVRELEIDLKNTKYELQSLTNILQVKTTELFNLQNHLTEIQRHGSSFSLSSAPDKQRLKTVTEQLNKAEYELNTLKQSIAIKQGYLSDTISERDRLKSRIEIVEEQLDRQRADARQQVNQLEQRILQQDRNNRQIEEQMRESLKKANQNNKNLTFGEADKLGRLKQLEEEVAQYCRLLEEEHNELSKLRKTSDEKIMVLENIKIELEGSLSQANLQLEHRTKEISKLIRQLAHKQHPVENQDPGNLQAQVVRLQAELDTKRSEYQNNLRKYRQQFEHGYKQTLLIYEDKIEELESQVSRKSLKKKVKITEPEKEVNRESFGKEPTNRKSLQKDTKDLRRQYEKILKENSKLKQQIDHYSCKAQNSEVVGPARGELEKRVLQFEQRITQVLDAKPTDTQTLLTQPAKNVVSELNAKLKKLRLENQNIKKKATQSKDNEDKLKEYQKENKKLLEGYNQHEQNVQRLIAEVLKLRQITQQYEKILIQNQTVQQVPTQDQQQVQQQQSQQVNQLERQKVLEQKLQFYKEKNKELEGRISQLIALVTELKRQLEQSGKVAASNTNSEFVKQQLQLTEQSVLNLQDQLKKAQEENNSLKSNHQNKEMTLTVEFNRKIAQLEASILDSNMRVQILKNQQAVLATEKSQLSHKVTQYESTIQDLSLQVQAFKRDTAAFTEQRIRLNELESVSAQITARLLATTTQKNCFESDMTNAKKQVARLEQQLKATNEKMTAMNNTNLSLEMQAAQNKTKIAQQEQRIKDLTQDLIVLHQYKADSDGFATHERTKLAQYQSRLIDNGYEMQRISKEKTAMELQLARAMEDLQAFEDLLRKLEADKAAVESELNRLQNGSVEAEFKSRISQLEIKIIHLNSELAQTHNQRQLFESQSNNEKELLISQHKNQIQELQSRIAKITQDYQRLQQDNSSLKFELSRSSSERTSNESQLKSVVSSLQSKVNILSSDLSRVTNQHNSLETNYNKLKQERSQMEGELIKLQGERSSLDSITKLKISQLEDRLHSFSHSVHLAEDQRTSLQQQSFEDKTKITQLESKLSELTARGNIHQADKERFVSENERLKRELLNSKESFYAADSERNQLRDNVSRLEQTISQLRSDLVHQTKTQSFQATYGS